MIYDVKIYGPNGKLKETKSAKNLMAEIWKGLDAGMGTPYAKQIKKKEKKVKRDNDYGTAVCGFKGCENVFQRNSKRHKFCKRERVIKSQQCQALHNAAKSKVAVVEITCGKCGVVFRGVTNRRYCGQPCKHS